MSLVGKALWLIETNLAEPATLNGIADQLAVTPYHLARAFAEATGQPLMRYVWRRRLTLAAQALAYGRESILTIALDAGYASPEAFTRAFRAEFGLTPSALRRSGAVETLTLTPPQQPRTAMTNLLTTPKIETMPRRRFAGPQRRYDMQTRAAIPAQWAAYNADGTRVPGATPGDYYGLVHSFSEETGTFDYICGQEVPAHATLPDGFASVTIEGPYARFATKGHISTMNAVWSEIYNSWMTRPEYRPRKGASVEYYPPEFNGMTGEGGYEVWLPIEP